MRRASGRTVSPGDRLLRHGPGARLRLGLGIGFGFVAAAIVVGQAWLTSVVVAGVFLGGASMATVATPLLAIAVLAVVRAGFLLAADGLAQGASARIKSTLRADLTAQLFALGPAWTRSRAERRAEQRADRRPGRHRRLRHLVPAGACVGRGRPAARPRSRSSWSIRRRPWSCCSRARSSSCSSASSVAGRGPSRSSASPRCAG